MEPNYYWVNVLAAILPFGCYYLGIIIRNIALPGENSPPLHHQCLIGIPVSLAVVSPMLLVLSKTYSDIPALLMTLGIIIEHGMLVNETATRRIKELVRKSE